MANTVLDALTEAARSAGGHVYTDGARTEQVPYARIAEEATVVARRLAGLGVSLGDTVALNLPDPRSFVLAFFGSMILGAIPVPMAPVNGRTPEGGLATARAVLQASGARWVIADDGSAATLVELAGVIPNLRVAAWEQVENASAAALGERACAPSDIAFLQFTSGSTAAPKGVAVTHECLLANARAVDRSAIRFEPETDLMVSWLPLHHDMGLVGFVITPLVASVRSALTPTATFLRRPSIWFDTVHSLRGTITFAPNFAFALMLRRLKERSLSTWDLSCLRILGCGAEPIDPDVLARFASTFEAGSALPRTSIVPCYGMAEATLAMTFGDVGKRYRVDEIDATEWSSSGRALPVHASPSRSHRVVSCGRPLEGHELAVLHEDGTVADEREEGDIVFRGPSVNPGYYGNAGATAATFGDGWLRTGDLGYVSGGELFVTGRRKDVIIHRGLKHHATDVERVAIAAAGARVGRVVAISVPGPETEHLALVVECPSSIAESVRRSVATAVGRGLDLAVHEVVTVPPGALPKTSSGKLRRADVRRWYLGRSTAAFSVGAVGGNVV